MKVYKPTTPGFRDRIITDRKGLWKGKPFKALTTGKKRIRGRNHHGKITVRFRGREITHPETARRQIDLIIEAVDDLGTVETSARLEGRTMTAILTPRIKVQPTR